MEFILSYIHENDAWKYWCHVEVMLDSGLEHADGKLTLADVKRLVNESLMQLWIVSGEQDGIVGSFVTEILRFPQKKVLSIVILGGVNFDKWKHLLSELEAFALKNECKSIEFHGRPGWERKYREMNFKKVHTIFRLSIKEK